jgi:hypothetical protein
MYRLFYNHEVSGDVLFAVIEPERKPDEVVSRGRVTALYAGGSLIGLNVFAVSMTVRLTAKGMIPAPDDRLIDAVNAILASDGFAPLPYTRDSFFHVAEVRRIEEHPLDEKALLVALSAGEKSLSAVTWYPNLAIGAKAIVATDGAILSDGSVFRASQERGIAKDCLICSGADLRMAGAPAGAFFVYEGYEPGDDYFLGGHR